MVITVSSSKSIPRLDLFLCIYPPPPPIPLLLDVDLRYDFYHCRRPFCQTRVPLMLMFEHCSESLT